MFICQCQCVYASVYVCLFVRMYIWCTCITVDYRALTVTQKSLGLMLSTLLYIRCVASGMLKVDEALLRQEIETVCARVGVDAGVEWPANFREDIAGRFFNPYRSHVHIVGGGELLERVLPSLKLFLCSCAGLKNDDIVEIK